MKNLTITFIATVTSLLFFSCNNFSGGWMSASSTSNEVLVIVDSATWNAPAGRALFDALNSPVSGLPQMEANFRIMQLEPENFSNTFKMARNIIIPDISSKYIEPKITSELDKYASGQVVMTIKAPNSVAFEEFVSKNNEGIVDYIVNQELERTAKWLSKESVAPKTHLAEKFGIFIAYPKSLVNITEDEDFFWATNNSGESRQDIAIYQFPYTTDKVFERDSLIAIRNQVLGKHIKGAFDSRMSTSVVYPSIYRKMEIDGLFRAELRGLWEMTTDMMGGPFVSHAFVNEKTGKVIVVDVMVYAPEKKKRNLIRNMEASLYTIKIVDENTENK